ncbi:MAG TPA: MGMT family protein [Anaerolineae bacterium]|jgi:methylated-DNA-protein-cysteine methyltransferase-like protein|nr:MGMT family protein [Anaerolineae bacterium]
MHDNLFEQVYRIASMIPRGQVATYGQIAAFLGYPRAARTVGWALNSSPEGMNLPWHRVINSQGRISGPPTGMRAHEQRALLEDEGIIFDESGRVDLLEYGWDITS